MRRDPNDNSFYCECKGCWWWRGGSGTHFCHYCHETGEPRGVLPKDCYKQPDTPYMTMSQGRKWEKENKEKLTIIKKISNERRKERDMANHGNYSIETKEAAVKAVLLDKEPQSVVCERFCIAKSTLGKWVTAAKREQQKYLTLAEKLEAEQSLPSVPAQKKMSGKEGKSAKCANDTLVAEIPAGTEILQESVSDMEKRSELDGIADRLCNDIADMEKIMRNFEKLQIVSNEEKQTLEKLFARANGFVMGIDYRR